MSRVRLYGLVIDTDFALHEVGAETTSDPDVIVRTGDPIDTQDLLPAGDLLLEFSTPHDAWYTLIRLPSGEYLFRVPSVCDFFVDADARAIGLAMRRDAAVGMDGVMVTGALLSLVLFLRGVSVLHGSAVEVDGSAIAFVGHSGQGKTTMATLLCAEGAAAVTDDVLVVDGAPHAPTVRRGSRELRLRGGMQELAARVDGSARRVSADDRDVLIPAASEREVIPLAAVLIPVPQRDGSPLRLVRLRRRDATVALASFPRLMGWRDHGVQQGFLADCAGVAASVPIFLAHVPWGPPFPEDLTGAIRAALREDAPG